MAGEFACVVFEFPTKSKRSYLVCSLKKKLFVTRFVA